MSTGQTVAPLQQEDLLDLPGRLRINPCLWDKEDVTHWLHWAHKEYSLKRLEKGCFEMNGRALCLLTKEDFRLRSPNSGDVLYEILQCVKHYRSGPLSPTQNVSVPKTVQGQGQNPVSYQFKTSNIIIKPQPTTVADTKGVSTMSRTQTQSCIQEPLNLSNGGPRQSDLQIADGRIPESKLLWDYVYQLLCDQRYRDYIRWEDQDSLVFRVVDPNGLAKLWGRHKNRKHMTYEKMSRALRHYYKLNIIKKEQGQKLLFRFLKLPHDIKKLQLDLPESPGCSPPRDQDFQETSFTEEYSQDRIEVSAGRISPKRALDGAVVR
ncbi:transcription factor ETV7 isoform X1 [Cynoglossus semilaevis]|uniref:transcription factor ETV7 isoform X1 n=2 Tax=Cynoglossus semilaevis TaxID=244447 RepID=UPI000498185A|nr:transcription factor ETV7 isoform X1 [Cynoglossus semilaevis]